MPSSFFGITIASSGLQAQQTAMDVTAHNIANSGNSYYKRQVAEIRASSPWGGIDAGVGQLGSGVTVSEIQRVQDEFIESQVMTSQQNLGQWTATNETLDKIVSIINEPSDYSLNDSLDNFWNAWQDLSQNRENIASRNNILEYGSAVAGSLNELYSQIEQVQSNQDASIESQVDDINRLTGQLATLNDQIQRTIGMGESPNDLLDQRSEILAKLSNMADIQVFGNGGAADVVSLGGHTLVQGNTAQQIDVGYDASGHAALTWADDGTAVQISGGQLGATIDLQRNVIPSYLDSLDQIANTLITRVNELHSSGYGLDNQTGIDFFQGTGARDIRVNSDLISNPRSIATAASADSPGDGSIALAIAKIKGESLISGSTLGDAYQTFVSKVGGDSSNASNMLEAQTYLQNQLESQQQSISGVSLDQELTDMVRFQQAYNANARVLSVMDDMLSTLIGTVGQ